VFSDYPANEKLNAMGIYDYFDAVSCAQDKDIHQFKPNPRGLHTVLEQLGVLPWEAIYIGDRPQIDGIAADRSGMDWIIIGSRNRVAAECNNFVRNYAQLEHLIRDAKSGQ
jgi:FMN phosphatase YigB (HAD superfamily)